MPYGGNLHISKVLSNVASEYMNNELIFNKVFGTVPVMKESDLYYTFNRDFRLEEVRRANGAVANQVTWGVSTSSYNLEEYALADFVTRRDRENSDSIQLDRQTTEFLVNKIQLRCEKDASDLLFTTTSWGNNETLTTATSWNNNTTTADVTQDVLSATSAIIRNSGKRANTMVIGHAVFEDLKYNTDIVSKIQYVERAVAAEDVLASMFDVDRLFVGRAIYDSGAEIPGTETISDIWGDDAWIGYLAPSANMREVSAAYIFQKMSNGNPYRTRKWTEDAREADVIEVSTMQKPKAVATSAAYLFKNTNIV